MAKNFDIEIGAHITILEQCVFTVEADTYEEAKVQAEARFQKYVDTKYGWVDYDSTYIEKLDEYEDGMI